MRMIICIALTLALARLAAAEPNEPSAQADLTQLPIEELMNIKVSIASKFPQKTMEAPSSVTIITAADIKTYGYRTLADIVRSVPGMSVTYDRNYDYIGIRGLGRTGDYNSRILLLVDGYRINDPIYDTAAIGTEFPVDVDLIDKVEIVRGPGSSIYGNNAVLGVINVITKHGKNFNGTEASGELASFGTDKERLSYGHTPVG
jgi:outer membrane receptor for ferrienterochelin and colicin